MIQSIPRIARFLNIPAASLDAGRSHENKTIRGNDVLGLIPQHYLRDKIERECQELGARLAGACPPGRAAA
jgi:hypothetical protein